MSDFAFEPDARTAERFELPREAREDAERRFGVREDRVGFTRFMFFFLVCFLCEAIEIVEHNRKLPRLHGSCLYGVLFFSTHRGVYLFHQTFATSDSAFYAPLGNNATCLFNILYTGLYTVPHA